ncbi:DUF883 family protein [Mesorhizobium sp. M1C.F.Ca.ET.193.01.1.1]|uniref:glycine zipper domain-containing protein n=2 Tax=Mesorhizobium TaxID=68287 RepID=UPI000FD1D622|nr:MULTISPECIES: DUF883 family protein [unclassified Mesorhizobium]TGT00342.1 DUF883 family protein [bacterium M00.F.Ca.ET.177.01.1.1]TGQ53748.1 DUF883 family protein [Mesorhizobium sp. M1C.F.Ca.ET.210.01.1.1]TGQ71781.1 DUF883 family protein [Mesorhizobium sp. M1C.F.Ca.ET.212.01.1.1]TGR08522.1 DUF883 family protein [Mesorhizobium sp. M1C.F.Ca.ET.204.01.1.1]TGR28762.1 DUF883 family protein [Mesorhizobium sp. M1C.F.Ca.ET.196.01.1.1]
MALFATDHDLDRQFAALSRQVDDLRKTLAKRGDAYYEDGREAASDYYSHLADRLHEALPAVRRRGRALERTARDHPATAAAVGLVVVGLLAGLLLSRR